MESPQKSLWLRGNYCRFERLPKRPFTELRDVRFESATSSSSPGLGSDSTPSRTGTRRELATADGAVREFGNVIGHRYV